MKIDPAVLAAVVSGALLFGLAVGAIVTGLGHRGQRDDDADRAGLAFRTLADLAQECADPVHLARLMRGTAEIWDNFRPDGLALEVLAPPPLTPGYVHRLIDAYASGRPLDLGGCWVPPDVQGRLRAITATAAATTSARTKYAASGPITAPTPPLAGDARLIRPRTSDG
ncbi:hypothetical protein [Micromonospora fulviviridis]|uniref:hypothetical protein n=1 Tax=Micromonospora fulviviridis TaxID=47860 RepID=UPI00378DC869